jgi:spermidine synthase
LIFRTKIAYFKRLWFASIITGIILTLGIIFSYKLTGFIQQKIFRTPVILGKRSPYHEIVLTKKDDDLRMFLNGHLQFSSRDEYRYHEALVHIPMSLVKNRQEILILGGGNGLAAREILKYKDVKRVTLP